MKRIVANIVLIILFFVLMVTIGMPFVAELYLKKAKKLEANYQWKRARVMYSIALHLNPLDAEYYAELGNALMRQAKKSKDKIYLLEKAKRVLERCVEINPSYSEYWYTLAKVRLEIYKNTPKSEEINRAKENFKKAIEVDPYNFRINYLVSHDLITLWEKLNKQERNFALERLKYALSVRSWYAKYIYPVIMYYVSDFEIAIKVTPETVTNYEELYRFLQENGLWDYRKRISKQLDSYRQKESLIEFSLDKCERLKRINDLKEKIPAKSFIPRAGWFGSSKDGNHIYENGGMYWTGTIDSVLELPKGKAIIYVSAKGTSANGLFPLMIVELDAEEIGEAIVNSTAWEEYSFQVNSDGGVKVLSITFANDGRNKEKGEDRNLFILEARVEKNE